MSDIKTDNSQTLVNALAEIERLRGRCAVAEIRKNEMGQVFICNPDGTAFRPSDHVGSVFYAGTGLPDAESLARAFHNCYERLAPEYGYVTREETKRFDPNSPNGKLMIAVCEEVSGYAQRLRNQADELENNNEQEH